MEFQVVAPTHIAIFEPAFAEGRIYITKIGEVFPPRRLCFYKLVQKFKLKVIPKQELPCNCELGDVIIDGKT